MNKYLTWSPMLRKSPLCDTPSTSSRVTSWPPISTTQRDSGAAGNACMLSGDKQSCNNTTSILQLSTSSFNGQCPDITPGEVGSWKWDFENCWSIVKLFLSDTIRRRRPSFFGHLSRADISQDHSRALQACILGPPKDWRRRVGRPRQTWLRTVEDDLRPLNFGLVTARRRAMDRSAWRLLVETATSTWHTPQRAQCRLYCAKQIKLLKKR